MNLRDIFAFFLSLLFLSTNAAYSQQCRLGTNYFAGNLCEAISVIPKIHGSAELHFQVFRTKNRNLACDYISALSLEKSKIFSGIDIANLDDNDLPFVFQQELYRGKQVPNSILASIDVLINITGIFFANELPEGRKALAVVPFFGRIHHFPLSPSSEASTQLDFSASLLGNIHELCKPNGIFVLVFSVRDKETNIINATDPDLISWSHIPVTQIDDVLSRHTQYRSRTTDLSRE